MKAFFKEFSWTPTHYYRLWLIFLSTFVNDPTLWYLIWYTLYNKNRPIYHSTQSSLWLRPSQVELHCYSGSWYLGSCYDEGLQEMVGAPRVTWKIRVLEVLQYAISGRCQDNCVRSSGLRRKIHGSDTVLACRQERIQTKLQPMKGLYLLSDCLSNSDETLLPSEVLKQVALEETKTQRCVVVVWPHLQ